MTYDPKEDKWWKKKYGWMSDDQLECFDLVCDVVGGEHHLCGKITDWGVGIKYNTSGGYWATFDFNNLTKLVVLGHDRMIRIDLLTNPGPNRYCFCLHKRHKREGRMSERHPTIEEAIETIRKPYETKEGVWISRR